MCVYLLILTLLCRITFANAQASTKIDTCVTQANGYIICKLYDGTNFRTQIDRDLPGVIKQTVIGMHLYVGESDSLHHSTDSMVYPEWSLYTKMINLNMYYYTATSDASYISADIFTGMNTLYILTMHTEAPIRMDIGYVTGVAGLETLSILTVHNFQTSGLTGNPFSKLKNLKKLRISSSSSSGDTIDITSILALSTSVPKLEELVIRKFVFTAIEQSRQNSGTFANLKILVLENAKKGETSDIRENLFFSATVFPRLMHLKLLNFYFEDENDFSNNYIFSQIPPLTLLEIISRNETSLDLSYLSKPAGNKPDIKHLTLINFQLGDLNRNKLSRLTNLESLYLKNSQNTNEIKSNSFMDQNILTKLTLSDFSGLQTIENNAFSGLTNLKFMSLMEMSKMEEFSFSTTGLKNLESLDIYKNKQLMNIPSTFFTPLIYLKSITIKKNKLNLLCPCSMSYLASLRTYSPVEKGKIFIHVPCSDFEPCKKNKEVLPCWDFEERCSHYCRIETNLTYTCTCPSTGEIDDDNNTCIFPADYTTSTSFIPTTTTTITPTTTKIPTSTTTTSTIPTTTTTTTTPTTTTIIPTTTSTTNIPDFLTTTTTTILNTPATTTHTTTTIIPTTTSTTNIPDFLTTTTTILNTPATPTPTTTTTPTPTIPNTTITTPTTTIPITTTTIPSTTITTTTTTTPTPIPIPTITSTTATPTITTFTTTTTTTTTPTTTNNNNVNNNVNAFTSTMETVATTNTAPTTSHHQQIANIHETSTIPTTTITTIPTTKNNNNNNNNNTNNNNNNNNNNSSGIITQSSDNIILPVSSNEIRAVIIAVSVVLGVIIVIVVVVVVVLIVKIVFLSKQLRNKESISNSSKNGSHSLDESIGSNSIIATSNTSTERFVEFSV